MTEEDKNRFEEMNREIQSLEESLREAKQQMAEPYENERLEAIRRERVQKQEELLESLKQMRDELKGFYEP